MASPGADQLKALLLGLWYGLTISATVCTVGSQTDGPVMI